MQAASPVERVQLLRALGDGVDVAGERQRHDIGVEPVDQLRGPVRPEPPCDWRIKTFLSIFPVPPAIARIDLAIELACRP